MSYADEVFARMCRDVIENGTDTKGEKVRPNWIEADGTKTPAYAIKKFGVVNRYDLRKEFPAVTFRKTPLKSCFDELLWIWQRKSNDIHDLNSHVWDEWADETGSIGAAYGYQQRLRHRYADVDDEGIERAFPDVSKTRISVDGGVLEAYVYDENHPAGESPYRTIAVKQGKFFLMTQFDKALYDLVNAPFSRRTIVDMWNPEDQYLMHLTPCAYSVTFNVTKENDELVLNMILNQRSNDLLAAGNWNVCQYALLLMSVARHCGMTAGEFVHVIADAHVYDRHVEIVRELIERERFPAPKVSLDPKVRNFYEIRTKHLIVEDYETGPQVKNIPIAV